MNQNYIYDIVAPLKLQFYYIIVVISFFYIVYKYRNESLLLLIILCFYSGLAAYMGKRIENPYKIFLVALTIYLAIKYKVSNYINKREAQVIIAFILFSLSFFLSAYINGDYLELTFSQYGKYFTPFILFLILTKYSKSPLMKIEKIGWLLFQLISIQVILSVFKFLIMGTHESIVGSITYIGGGQAAILPVLGFILLWHNKRGNFKKYDWLFVILLLFIGFVNYKRAIWFVFPVIAGLYFVFIKRKVNIKYAVLVLFAAPLIFYFGVRLNPTLNKEQKIWGSFDLDYVLNYAEVYSFGKDTEQDIGTGRGGATLLLFDKLTSSDYWTFNNIFGYGLNKIYTKSYDEFDEYDFGINSLGSATGVFQSFICGGYLEVAATLFYILSLLLCIKMKKIRYVFAFLIFWDYFFYSGLILRTQALSILFFYSIIYSNERWKAYLTISKGFFHYKIRFKENPDLILNKKFI